MNVICVQVDPYFYFSNSIAVHARVEDVWLELFDYKRLDDEPAFLKNAKSVSSVSIYLLDGLCLRQ